MCKVDARQRETGPGGKVWPPQRLNPSRFNRRAVRPGRCENCTSRIAAARVAATRTDGPAQLERRRAMAESPTRSGDAVLTPAEALAEIRREFGTAPSYNQLWARIVDGRVPAHRDGRAWRIRRADLPPPADACGLSVARPVAA